MKRKFLFAAVVFCLCRTGVSAMEHPCMFLNQAEINALKSKINTEPWKSGYSRLMSDANSYLSAATVNVMGGELHSSGDPHMIYMGKYYSGGDQSDNHALTKFGAAVRSLGLAYAMTGQAKYADKALKFIYDWCFNPATYMKPANATDQGSAQAVLFLSVSMPKAYFGADLIWNYSGWTKAKCGFTRDEFKNWVMRLCTANYSIKGSKCENNWQDWNHFMYAASMVIVEHSSLLSYLFKSTMPLMACKMNSQGRMEHEYSRSEGGIKYTNYSLTALTQLAEIARHHGVDYYNYKADGKGLEKACDYIAPYVKDPSSFPWVSTSSSGHRDYLELAYFAWKKQPYIDALKKNGRPVPISHAVGHPAFTHAYGAFPFTVSTPDGGGTGITMVMSPVQESFKSGVTVNLFGRKVVDDPSVPGIYIRFGQDGPEKQIIIR